MNPKVIENLINKIGITPVQAVWIMGISEKYAVWIANQVKANPEIFPKGGSSLKKIITWKQKNPGIDINEYDYRSAFESTVSSPAKHFKKGVGSLKNEKVVAVCEGSQYKWVEIKTDSDCKEEGEAMNHCLCENNEYVENGARVFSLRNEFNKPIITTQILTDGTIGQYSANSNEPPAEEHHKYFAFLENQLKLKVSEFSKYERGIQKKAPSLDAVYEGDLTLDFPATIPEGFIIKGNLDIEYDGKKEIVFPKGVKINGSLTIYGKVSLPSDIHIGGHLLINDGAVKIASGVIVKNNVMIEGGDVKFDGPLTMGGDFVISRHVNLPNGLVVGGNLTLNVDNALPKDIVVGGDMLIKAMTVLPDGLTLHKSLEIRNSKVVIPNGLSVKRNLILREVFSPKIPDGTSVGMDLVLGHRPIDINLQNIKVGGTVRVL